MKAARRLALAMAALALAIGLAACGSGIEGPVETDRGPKSNWNRRRPAT